MTDRDLEKTFNSSEEAENFIADIKKKYRVFNCFKTENEDGTVTVQYDRENCNYFPSDNWGGRSFGKFG